MPRIAILAMGAPAASLLLICHGQRKHLPSASIISERRGKTITEQPGFRAGAIGSTNLPPVPWEFYADYALNFPSNVGVFFNRKLWIKCLKSFFPWRSFFICPISLKIGTTCTISDRVINTACIQYDIKAVILL